jgi:hypothetical protein
MNKILYEDRKNFFSAWVFVFFMLYYFNLSFFNPIILLILAFIVVLFSTTYIYIESKSIYHTMNYFGINMFVKFLPILLIIDRPIYYHDFITSIIMIALYYTYVTYYINFDVIEFYTQMPADYLKSIIETFTQKM